MEVGEIYGFVAFVTVDFCLFLRLETDLSHWRSDKHLILVLLFVFLLLIAWRIVFLIYFRLKIQRNVVNVRIYISFAVSRLDFEEGLLRKFSDLRFFLFSIDHLLELLLDLFYDFDLVACLHAHLLQPLTGYV